VVQSQQNDFSTVPKFGSYIPALDGIRGIAIMLVMIYHSLLFTGISTADVSDKIYYKIVNSYWLGVDIFFVLSGFLITGLLYDTRENRRFFSTFYARRSLRIFPVYYAVLFVLFWIRPFFAASPQLARISTLHQLWYWGYAANLLIAMKGWSPFSLGLLDHLWTLAVEEQFYLFWPLIVFFFRQRTLIIISAVGIIASLGLRIALVCTGNIVPAYVLTFSRMDTLAVGALVALVARYPNGFSFLAKLGLARRGSDKCGAAGNRPVAERFLQVRSCRPKYRPYSPRISWWCADRSGDRLSSQYTLRQSLRFLQLEVFRPL
jgi:peptidoglycan/LPS O-acetylase OafA/YrhL